jgi:ABC-type antimicrobial peptide transport system permease subunit
MVTDVVNPALSWTVWALILLGTFLMTIIGTWLIARRWEK